MGKGFVKFVKDLADVRALGVVALGFGLPTLASAAYSRIESNLVSLPLIGNVLGNEYGRAGVGVVTAAGIAYAATSLGLLNNSEASAAAMIASTMFIVGALKNRLPAMLRDNLPSAFMGAGYSGSYVNGYSGGYLGYLGNALDEPATDMATNEPMLYGVGAAPKINIF
jgi:hypothetical protein